MNCVLRINTAGAPEIEQFLVACDGSFAPPLSTRVNLQAFAGKILAGTVRFEAWEDGLLIGLVSSYFNDLQTRAGFINHVSVLPSCRGRGIAAQLLVQCVRYGQQHGFAVVGLEVSADNEQAIRLYRRVGFVAAESGREFLKMTMQLTPSQEDRP